MEVPEKDLSWEKLEVRWMTVKVRPKLYGLGHQKPDDEDGERGEIGRFVLVLLRSLQGPLQQISQGTVHDQSWWVERGQVQSVGGPWLNPPDGSVDNQGGDVATPRCPIPSNALFKVFGVVFQRCGLLGFWSTLDLDLPTMVD